MIYLVEFRGYGHAFAIVRASSEVEAFTLADLGFDREEVTVKMLDHVGEPAVLWSDSDCPDSVR